MYVYVGMCHMQKPLKGEFTFFCRMENMRPDSRGLTYLNVSQFTKATCSAGVGPPINKLLDMRRSTQGN